MNKRVAEEEAWKWDKCSSSVLWDISARGWDRDKEITYELQEQFEKDGS